MAKAKPFRFSTKYQDYETDLLYYGERYLKDGRWVSRDPAGEAESGPNLYGFVADNPLTKIDPVGWREVVQPASAIGEVVELFNYLSDLRSWAEGAETHSD